MSHRTTNLLRTIKRCMAPDGLFLCRVNSERDYLHGAGQGAEIEPGFYRQDARYAAAKRFFSESDLDRLLPAATWRQLSRREVHHRPVERAAWPVHRDAGDRAPL